MNWYMAKDAMIEGAAIRATHWPKDEWIKFDTRNLRVVSASNSVYNIDHKREKDFDWEIVGADLTLADALSSCFDSSKTIINGGGHRVVWLGDGFGFVDMENNPVEREQLPETGWGILWNG